MYYLIYKTTNKINGKYYIGMHKTDDLDDGYLGSGSYFRNALKKYGRENFEREILEYCNSNEEMLLAETRYVTEDVVNDKSSYNLTLGGFGGWYCATIAYKEKLKDPEWYKMWHQKVSEANAKANASQSHRDKISKTKKNYFKTHPGIWVGRHHKESTKKKIGAVTSNAQKGAGNSQYGTCWISNTLIKKSIKIKKEFLYDCISEGWIKKRIIKW